MWARVYSGKVILDLVGGSPGICLGACPHAAVARSFRPQYRIYVPMRSCSPSTTRTKRSHMPLLDLEHDTGGGAPRLLSWLEQMGLINCIYTLLACASGNSTRYS